MNPENIPLGLYLPGSSPLHRMSARLKFLSMLGIVVCSSLRLGSTALSELCWSLALLSLCAVGFVIARVPPGVVGRQLLAPLPFILILCLFLLWRQDPITVATLAANLFAAIMAAILLTLTTSTAQLMDAVESFFRHCERLGMSRRVTDTVVLAITLAIRVIPRIAWNIHEVLEARKARGATWSVMAFGVPLIVKTLLMAVHLGEALISRGR